MPHRFDGIAAPERQFSGSNQTDSRSPGHQASDKKGGMLRGERIGLRARQEADVAVLHAELYNDVATANRAFPLPWRPMLPGAEPPFAIEAPSDVAARFSVVELTTDELIGHAALWGID